MRRPAAPPSSTRAAARRAPRRRRGAMPTTPRGCAPWCSTSAPAPARRQPAGALGRRSGRPGGPRGRRLRQGPAAHRSRRQRRRDDRCAPAVRAWCAALAPAALVLDFVPRQADVEVGRPRAHRRHRRRLSSRHPDRHGGQRSEPGERALPSHPWSPRRSTSAPLDQVYLLEHEPVPAELTGGRTRCASLKSARRRSPPLSCSTSRGSRLLPELPAGGRRLPGGGGALRPATGSSLAGLFAGLLVGLVHDALTGGPFGLFGFADTIVGLRHGPRWRSGWSSSGPPASSPW